MKNKYYVIINGSDFSHWYATLKRLDKAKRLALEIARSGCYFLEMSNILSDDLILNRITIDVYDSNDDLKYSKVLSKKLRNYLLKQKEGDKK
jgi:hypothetical protein